MRSSRGDLIAGQLGPYRTSAPRPAPPQTRSRHDSLGAKILRVSGRILVVLVFSVYPFDEEGRL